MAGVGLTPGRSMAAENIRDLQNRARHARRALGGWLGAPELERDMLERAHDLTDRLGGDPGIGALCSRVWRDRAALGSPECRCCARADGWQSCVVRGGATRAYRSRPGEARQISSGMRAATGVPDRWLLKNSEIHVYGHTAVSLLHGLLKLRRATHHRDADSAEI